MSLKREILRQTMDLVKHLDLKTNLKCKLSPLQLRTLTYIQQHECVKPTQIAKEFNITPATVTAQIDKLVNKGWLERCSCKKDRRVVDISLTKKAKDELDSIIESTVKKYEWFFTPLTLDEQKTLLDMINRIHQSAHINKEKE